MIAGMISEPERREASLFAVTTRVLVAFVLGVPIVLLGLLFTYGAVLLPVTGALAILPFFLLNWVLWGRNPGARGTRSNNYDA